MRSGRLPALLPRRCCAETQTRHRIRSWLVLRQTETFDGSWRGTYQRNTAQPSDLVKPAARNVGTSVTACAIRLACHHQRNAARDVPDEIVGLVTGCLSWHLEFDGPAARLTALVVDESVRGQGVARLLVNVFEAWAREQGARRASLNSGVERDGAHAAYEKLGWSITGVRFSKDLSTPEPQDPLSIGYCDTVSVRTEASGRTSMSVGPGQSSPACSSKGVNPTWR